MLRLRLLVAAALVAPLCYIVCLGVPAQAQDDFTQQVLTLVNQERVAHGLSALALDPRLVNAAQTHTNAMAAAGQMLHVGKWRTPSLSSRRERPLRCRRLPLDCLR